MIIRKRQPIRKNPTYQELQEQVRALEQKISEYQLINQHALDMIGKHDPQGVFTYASSASHRLLGYTPEELIGRNAYDFFHPEDLEAIRKSHTEILRGAVIYAIEYRFRHKSGHYVWVEAQSKTIVDPHSGAIREIIASTRDIGDRKIVENKLRESEKRYRLITEHSLDIISKHDIQGTVTFASPACHRLTGYTPEELVGRKPREFVHPDDFEAILKNHREIAETRNVLTVSYRFRHKAGHYMWFEAQNKTIVDPDSGLVTEIIANVRDISDRKATEEKLRESEKRYRFLAENMGDIVWVLDKDLNTTYVSPSIERVLGTSIEDRKRMSLKEKYPPRSYKRLMAEFETRRLAIEKGQYSEKTLTIELEYYHGNGSIVWMESKIQTILDENGEFQGIYGVSRDITERKRMEAEKENLIDKLNEALSKVKTLSGFLPICMICKRIRDDQGYWNQLENYIRDHSQAEFSHSICKECAKKHYGDYLKKE